MSTVVDGRLLLAIYEAAKAAGWTRTEVTTFTVQQFDKLPEELTLAEAGYLLVRFHHAEHMARPPAS
jgi:hypothetical protein